MKAQTQTLAKLLITFTHIVEAGGISAAARLMEMDKAAVSRQLRELELQLGVSLMRRNGTASTLTDIGQTVYQHAARVVQEVESAGLHADSVRETPTGVLSVSSSNAFGKHQLMPRLAEFLRVHPQIEVELCLLDRFVHPVDEGFDVLLRICDAPPEDLVAHRLANIQYTLVAAPDWVRGVPAIRKPEDLHQHPCLFYGYKQRKSVWHLQRGSAITAVNVSARLSVNQGEALRQAALDGLGVALLPNFLVAGDIQNGLLQPLLTDHEVKGTLGTTLYALHLPGRLQSLKVRAFIQHFKQVWQDSQWATS